MIYGKRGLLVRLLYLFTAVLFFCVNKAKRNNRSGIIVLCFHGVEENQKKKFARQMQIIEKRTVSIKNFYKPVKNNKQNLSICVTFDDAFANLLVNVIPIVDELHIPITIFIATDSLGTFPSWLQGSTHSDSKEMVMSVDQLLELKKNILVTFGSHTMSHPRLSQMQEDEMREELCLSRGTIQEIIHEQIYDLALPHGDYNDRVIRVAMEEGYKKIYTLDPIVYSCESNSAPHLVGRFSISPDVWPIEFYLTINGAYTWLYAWRSFVKNVSNLAHQR